MPFDFSRTTPPVTIKDRHCGYGKSTDLIASLRPDRSYLIVLPLQTEVDRFIQAAPIDLVEPSDEGVHRRKRDHLRELLIGGYSIVTTHALFTDVAHLDKQGLWVGYDVIVEEVLNIAQSVTREVLNQRSKATVLKINSWKGHYLEQGFANVES